MNTKALAVAASLWVPMVASAATEASVADKQEALSAQLEQILAKNGISIGGSFRGEVGSSTLDGNAASELHRNDEAIGYTSVDFDIRARPNTSTTARAVFRMYMDHASFFGSPFTPMQARWLSLDGAFADMAYYHLGNLQAKWSPLVIGATEPGFLYTPRIFAQQQKQAMDERFIGGGVRNLQGANLGLRAAIPGLQIDSFDVSALAAKLLSAAALGDPSENIAISKGNLTGDDMGGWPVTLANFDRWAVGGKGNIAFLHGISIGGSYLKTMDLRSTYGTTDTLNKVTRKAFHRDGKSDSVVWIVGGSRGTSPDIYRDTVIQNGGVFSGTFGARIGDLIGNKSLIANVDVDVARSSWDYFSAWGLESETLVKDTTTYTSTIGYFKPTYVTKSGLGLNLSVTGGWKTDLLTFKAKGGYLMNDSLFRSDLAQAPVFMQSMGRVFNTEQDVGALLSHYNTFDALYHNVHKFIAEDKNEYAKSPYDKVAYTNYVGGGQDASLGKWTVGMVKASTAYDVADSILGAATDSTSTVAAETGLRSAKAALYTMALFGSGKDRDLQLVLPGGEATANRVGPKFGLDFDLMQGGVEVKVDGYLLEEAKGSVRDSFTQTTAKKAKFQQIQAGGRLRADRFINGWKLPLELSGSVGISTAKGGDVIDYSSTALNAGLYVGVIKRLSVLAGFQQIKGKDKAFLVDQNQTNMAGGLEFKVQEGAYLLGMYNLIKTEFPNATEYNFDQNIWSTKIAVSF